jgi:hypothetical protein
MGMKCIVCILSSMIAFTLMISLAQGEDAAPATTQASPSNPSNQPSKPGAKSKVVYKEKSYYDFEDVLINGNVRAPDGSFIFRKNDSNFSSTLNLKRSFIPELKESSTSAR